MKFKYIPTNPYTKSPTMIIYSQELQSKWIFNIIYSNLLTSFSPLPHHQNKNEAKSSSKNQKHWRKKFKVWKFFPEVIFSYGVIFGRDFSDIFFQVNLIFSERYQIGEVVRKFWVHLHSYRKVISCRYNIWFNLI